VPCPRNRPLVDSPSLCESVCRGWIRGGFAQRWSRILAMGTLESGIRIDPEVLSGTPCFVGTRVPVRTLIDYLKAGDRVADFLADFPTVRREQVAAVLDAAAAATTAHAHSA
jgi:uncharacterized protein (DUF433 family)